MFLTQKTDDGGVLEQFSQIGSKRPAKRTFAPGGDFVTMQPF